MKYQQFLPPEFLKNHVRYFWRLENTAVVGVPKTFGPLADGCPGLIFQETPSGYFHDQDNKQLPAIFLYGQTTKHTRIYSPSNFTTLGVYLYPNALKAIFGIKADDLTDTCLDLNSLALDQGINLVEQLENAGDTLTQIKVLSDFLFLEIKRNRFYTDDRIQFAVTKINTSKGSVSLKELQTDLNLTERSFERKFKDVVGITPKMFSRICRFQHSLNQLKGNNYEKLSDIAFENEYSDQSHFIRAFKEFTGCSPIEYRKQFTELVTNYPEIAPE